VKDIVTNDEKLDEDTKRQLIETLHDQDMDIFLAEVKDRDSARNREIEVVKAHGNNSTQHVLAYIGVAGFIAMVAFILTKGLKEMTEQEAFIVGNLVGAMGGIATTIFAYYFGSSKGSDDKTKIMNEQVKG
jgi:hypothetical protein